MFPSKVPSHHVSSSFCVTVITLPFLKHNCTHNHKTSSLIQIKKHHINTWKISNSRWKMLHYLLYLRHSIWEKLWWSPEVNTHLWFTSCLVLVNQFINSKYNCSIYCKVLRPPSEVFDKEVSGNQEFFLGCPK